MVVRTILTAMGKGVVALALGSAVLGHVAGQAGPQQCQAVIHVTEADVDVWVDGMAFRVGSWRDSPVLCPLAPGRHELRMTRDGRTLYQEAFTLRGNDDVVLTAWDPARPMKAGH
jgi:hypothetical protein